MRQIFTIMVCLGLLGMYMARPVAKGKKGDAVKESASEEPPKKETKHEQQDAEYFRYLTQIVGELEKDPKFKEKLHNATEEDIRTGKISEHLNGVDHDIRSKLDELKRMEVQYQQDLVKEKKDHMRGIDRNYWNPVHHDNQDTFEIEDMQKLLSKHNDMMNEQDEKRKKEFKEYEMEKEHRHRDERKKMSEEERKSDDVKVQETKTHQKDHPKLHEPGHKAQLEEVWEKEDGLDPDSFDSKTFFNLHDKNNDGVLDQYEIDTIFLADLDKAYNESDPLSDPREREEEMERMREQVLKEMDKDADGLLSREEFMAETKDHKEEFDRDDEYKPLTDEDQFTDEELAEYERMLEEEAKNGEHNEEPEEHDEKHEPEVKPVEPEDPAKH